MPTKTSLNSHDCQQIETINNIAEDVNTLKIAFGYKEKSNGEFREQVEKEDNSIRDDIRDLSTELKELRNIMINILIALFGVLGILMTILILAIKLY